MPAKLKHNAEEVIAALKEGNGYVSQTATILKVTPKTVYNYADKWPTVKAAWDGIREARHDYVENALMKNIRNGHPASIIFYLKTQCKQRGYIEKVQTEHTGHLDLSKMSDDDLRTIAGI